MEKLIRGIVHFRKNVRPSCKKMFAQLALGQRPDALFIACSDSRVVPNLFASTDPGDLFVLRNMGNLVPPFEACERQQLYSSETAAIEFALCNLPIKDIIVCGHSECGAMRALIEGRHNVENAALQRWLRYCDVDVKSFSDIYKVRSDLELHDRLSQVNVLQQLKHLQTYPIIQQRIRQRRLRLHGWWFDIREADVYAYAEDKREFRIIDERYANVLIEKEFVSSNQCFC
jgi:carbonic anhydrase